MIQNVPKFIHWFWMRTHISGYAQLAVFIRYKSKNIMREKLVKLLTLRGKTTGMDIFKECSDAVAKTNSNLKKNVSVASDDADATTKNIY